MVSFKVACAGHSDKIVHSDSTFHKNMINLIFKLERKTNRFPLFFVIFFIDLIFHLCVSWLVNLYDPGLLEIFQEEISLTEIFILSVIVGPLIETFLFQYIVIELLYSLKKIKTNFIVIISALVFSLIHNYNLIYIIVTFIAGLIYALYYVYLKKTKKKYPFMYIWMLHTLYNLTVFILDL